MHFPLTTFTILSLSGAVFCHGGDEAESVSVADFKTSFTTAAIVPEVLAAFNPSVGFYVGFASSDGDGELLEPGMTLTKEEAKAPFELSVEGIDNAVNVTADTRFIVYMIGPDVPSRAKPTSRNVRHYLAGNFTVSSANSSLLATAVTLTNSSAATNEYAAPAPSPGTGQHRYIYLLYTQPAALNTKSFASLGFNASNRVGFNLTEFRELVGLGPSIGGTYFVIDTDSNSTSPNDTTEGSNSTTDQGSGAARVGGTRWVSELGVGVFVAGVGAVFMGFF